MGLLGNGFRQNLTGRITTAAVSVDGCNASAIPASYNQTAFRRNMLLGWGIQNLQASVPSGKRPPNVWLMAKEGGSISSFLRSNIAINAVAVGELGFPRSGSATIAINASAAGGLIVGATGTATISINGQASIVATLAATGAASITINASAALDAIASLQGAATLSIDGQSAIMGVGLMTGSTIESGALTPAGIAGAVWQALDAQNNAPNTMGAKLNAAGSGGVDLNALAAAVVAALQATTIPVDITKIRGQPVNGTGSEIDPWGP